MACHRLTSFIYCLCACTSALVCPQLPPPLYSPPPTPAFAPHSACDCVCELQMRGAQNISYESPVRIRECGIFCDSDAAYGGIDGVGLWVRVCLVRFWIGFDRVPALCRRSCSLRSLRAWKSGKKYASFSAWTINN